MKKNIVISVGLLAVCLSGLCACSEGNGKKVYADYHGVRYTREHDGKNGRWEMYADTEKSSTGRKTLCYNADLVDDNGRHDMAVVAYPQAGMQSNLDEDYLEYQILSAKTAKIDGFFIEWGYLPHENDVLLRAMQKTASRYDFEIGVNWCDGWLYYNWITKIYPEIDTREEKTGYMARCYQYLVDSVYSVSTAATVNGRPVFYHFGPGATADEYRKVLSQVKIPEGMQAPVGLRRWADWGTLQDGKYIPVTESADMDEWKEIGEIPTAWLPARVRTRDAEHPHWDNYAIADDLIEFMKPFRDSIWMSDDPRFVIKSGFAMPGMDNRGCAGWGRGHFFYIPRNGGETYEDMWRFCMESKDSLDMMFVASWSDYTEGHEIEPTVENGDRELRTTLKYASGFKEEKYDESGLELPLKLFGLRKDVEFAEACGLDASACTGILDKAAAAISEGRYARAGRALAKAAGMTEGLKARIKQESISVESPDGTEVYLGDELVSQLDSHHYTGFISFDYLDKGREYLFVRSATDREPEDAFNVVGKLRTDGTGVWKRARIRLYDRNIAFRPGSPAFTFSGNVDVRNVSLDFNVYSLK